MGWWSQLFGGEELPRRTRGPSAPELGGWRDGKRHGVWVEEADSKHQLIEVLYRAGVRQGPFRLWHLEAGVLQLSGTMVDGQQHGTIEAWRRGTVYARFERVAGKMHGRYRSLNADGTLEYECEYRDDQAWSGEHRVESTPGVYILRETLRDGERTGAYEENDWVGKPKLRANYLSGKLDGDFRTFHDNGAVKLEGRYASGMRVGQWRLSDRDGRVLAEDAGATGWVSSGHRLPPAQDDELEKWVSLAAAWSSLPREPWFRVELAVDAFADPAAAIAWLKERVAEGPSPRRTTLGRGWVTRVEKGDGDPRVELLDGIAIDNHHWGPEQVARVLRLAPQLRELCLYECLVEPGLDALFPDGVAWPELDRLELTECGESGELLKRLAEAQWATRLQRLALGGADGVIAGAHAAALMRSDRLTSLTELTLHGVGKGFAAALASSPVLDRLERLQLNHPAEPAAILSAISSRATPTLRELELRADGTQIGSEVLLGLADPALRPNLQLLVLEDFGQLPKTALAQIEKSRPGLELEVA